MKRQRGFTLVELLVTIPIFLLIIAGLIGFLVTLYANLLMKDAEVQLSLEAQEAINAIQDDLYFARNFAEGASSAMVDANGPGGNAAGWTFNTTPATLIVYEIALDKPRQNPNRAIVYQRTASSGNSCDPDDIEMNPPVLNNLIYYVDSAKNLRRRILVPDPVNARCSEPIREQSCASDGTRQKQTSGGPVTVACAADAILASDVKTFAITYRGADNTIINIGSGGSPLQAETVTITLTLERKVVAETITQTNEITVKKINSGDPNIQ